MERWSWPEWSWSWSWPEWSWSAWSWALVGSCAII